MAERPEHLESVDRPEPEQVLDDPPPPGGDRPRTDADDRPVELDEPAATEPPVDDDDRDPAVQERRAGSS